MGQFPKLVEFYTELVYIQEKAISGFCVERSLAKDVSFSELLGYSTNGERRRVSLLIWGDYL